MRHNTTTHGPLCCITISFARQVARQVKSTLHNVTQLRFTPWPTKPPGTARMYNPPDAVVDALLVVLLLEVCLWATQRFAFMLQSE
jgi:hypothetical protein